MTAAIILALLLMMAIGWGWVLLALDTPYRLTIGRKIIATIGAIVCACGLMGLASVTEWWLFLMWLPLFGVNPVPEYLSGGRGCG